MDEIKPSIEATRKAIPETGTPKKGYSVKQIRPIEAALYQRIDDIGKLMKKMDGLKMQVEDAFEAGVVTGR